MRSHPRTQAIRKGNETLLNMVRVETDQEKIARLEHDLAECYRLTGADPDGNEDWRLAAHAVEAVREFRQEYDEASDSSGRKKLI